MKFYECELSLDMEHPDVMKIDNVPDEIIYCITRIGRNYDDTIEGVDHFATHSIAYAKVYVQRQMEYFKFIEWDDMPDGTYRLTLNGVVLTMTETDLDNMFPVTIRQLYRDRLQYTTPEIDDQPITPHTVIKHVMRVPVPYTEEGDNDENL